MQVLVDLECTYMDIDEQLVKDKRIQIKPINLSFKVFNTDRIKNREVTRVVSLKIKINRHKKQLEATVMNLNRMDMFLEYDWLVKHNSEVNQKNRIIQFIRCPRSYKMKYQDIEFKTRKIQAMKNKKQEQIQKIRKRKPKCNKIQRNLLDYI